jgi:hypothetical protein
MKLVRSIGGATFVGALACAGVAGAHQGHPVLRAERTIKLEADGDEGVRMVVTINLGAEEMLRIARRADENGDGLVDVHEVEEYMLDWADILRRGLPVRVDGSFARVDFVQPFFDPKGAISLRPGTLEYVGRIRVPSGTHALFVTDDMNTDEFDRTDVMFTSTNDARLVASGPSEAPDAVTPSFAYGRTTDRRRVRAIGMVVDMPPPETTVLPRAKPIGIAIPASLLASITLFALTLGRLLRAIRVRNAARRRGASH